MCTAQAFVVETQQRRRRRHIMLGAHAKGHPPGVRQHVMRFCAPGSDKLAPHAYRKRNIEHAVDMHVSDFTSIDAKFEATKSMRQYLDPGPRPYRGFEAVRDVLLSDSASP